MNKHIPLSAIATIKGSKNYPNIYGYILFRQYSKGVLVTARLFGLPYDEFLGFHIHEGNECSGTSMEEFVNTGGHYNPKGLQHPYHSGDLPPLLSNNGEAYMSVLTNRFTIQEIIGRTAVIHSNSDDFKSQPSGNSGVKIACGVIKIKI